MSVPETPVPAESVRAQLARILGSDGFVSSQRLCRFLRFIVERTLENDVERLKEFVVAMEVFDRNEDYDPSIDSIVRVEARRLRAKLKAYYDGPGSTDPVLIGLRPGSYVPLFRPLAAPAPVKPVSPAPAPATAEYTTIAVLPFVNMSPEPEQDYFCDGIAEEIINALASIEGLAVVARTSAFQFKGKAADIREVGEKLGAQVVVEGSVRKAGSQLRITVQAIDALRGYHLWSETYRRELLDIFAVQEEISIAIANTLSAKLPVRALRTAAEYQPSLEAYTAFFRARHLLERQGLPELQEAMARFGELTRLYPDYADPYAGIATAYAVMSLFGAVSGRQVLPTLRGNAEAAVRLNPESADGWTVMAGISAHWEFDWHEADKRFRRALSLQPSNFATHSWYGMVLAMQKRFAEAESILSAAIRINPLSASAYARYATLSYLQGDDTLASAQLGQALAIQPECQDARLIVALVGIRRADYAAAVEALSPDVERIPLHAGLLAGTYALWGKKSEYRRVREKLDEMAAAQFVTPLARALADIGAGDLDGAFEALSEAVRDRTIFVNLAAADPYYEPLRRDARFNQLLTTMNLRG